MSVAARVRRPRAPPFIDPPGHARHRPEATLLYQLVGQHYPERPLRQGVLSLPHALRFLLATNPAAHMQVLGVVYRINSRCLVSQAGLKRARQRWCRRRACT